MAETKPARFVGGPFDGKTIDVAFPFRDELRMLTGIRPATFGTVASRNPFLYAVYRLAADAESEYRHVEPKGRPVI